MCCESQLVILINCTNDYFEVKKSYDRLSLSLFRMSRLKIKFILNISKELRFHFCSILRFLGISQHFIIWIYCSLLCMGWLIYESIQFCNCPGKNGTNKMIMYSSFSVFILVRKTFGPFLFTYISQSLS